MRAETEMIQPGWAVFASGGEEVGTVVRHDAHILVIKHGGLLRTKEWDVPLTSVSDVETGRVELGLTKAEIEQYKPR